MKSSTLKRLCQSLGLASLILVLNYGELLGGGADLRMHTPFPVTGICIANIADILILTLVLFFLLAALARTRVYPWLCLLLVIAVPPFLLERSQPLFPHDFSDGVIPLITVLWTGAVLLLRLRFLPWYRGFLRVASQIAAALALFAVVATAQLLWVATWKPAPSQIEAAWNPSHLAAPLPPRNHPLVVWIIFDELSYQQTFGHRARDLQLPSFDALRAQSTLYTQTRPIGYHTVNIVPGLFTGNPIDTVRFDRKNQLAVHYIGRHGFQPLNGSGTIFADAQALGWRTAIVGWYNPYCSLYASALQSCYWTNRDGFDGPMAYRYSIWNNAVTPLLQLAHQLVSPGAANRALCSFQVRQRYLTETDLQQHAFQLLHTDQADFVFLHLAIPHSPNIWSRIDGNYAQGCDSSYLDNLALVDHVLGQVLATLQASPRWPQTALIVQGDHGWRVNEWNEGPAWTPEDDDASREIFDPRPALLIHSPGQTQSQTVSTPWPISQVHTTLEHLLHQ